MKNLSNFKIKNSEKIEGFSKLEKLNLNDREIENFRLIEALRP